MAETEVLTRVEGGLGHITLDRPRALNALTPGMVKAIDDILTQWEADRAVRVVLIDGAGERGFCAGGDIRWIYQAARSGEIGPVLTFWQDEYRLNARLARFPKPIVAIMDGLVMGGGVGLSAHLRHRIVTETTAVAMPEVRIGFVPDVGGTYLLARAPGELGTHAALTGGQFGPADAMALGLADAHVVRDRLAELTAALRDIPGEEVGRVVASFAGPPAAGEVEATRAWVDQVYASDDVGTILEALERRAEPAAAAAAAQLRQNSPTSLKVTLRALRTARSLARLEDCLAMEFRAAAARLSGPDMVEGIRAAVIDKDRAPKWSPMHLADVTEAMVDHHFASRGDRDLVF